MGDRDEWAEPWPFWKFGLKQNDLHTTLHEKYNTFPSAIQDPEAFHHDVYEISSQACTLSEFEHSMEERKMQRLGELNSMLEDASFEIIGCPRLIGTDQWVHAVQLFRTKSLDSLVRYFASYLPDEHPWHRDSDSTIIDSSGSDAASDAVSPVSPIDYDGPILFDEPEEDDAIYTNQPSESFSAYDISIDHPKRANTGRSEDSGVSVNERHLPSTRAASFSESEPLSSLEDSMPALHNSAATSPSDDPATPSSSISDLGNEDGESESHIGKRELETTIMDHVDGGDGRDGYFSVSRTYFTNMNTMDSDETSTPKAAVAQSPATPATPLFDTKVSPLVNRKSFHTRSHPNHDAHHPDQIDYQENRKHLAKRQMRRREGSVECGQKAKGVVAGGRTRRAREVSPGVVRPRASASRLRSGV